MRPVSLTYTRHGNSDANACAPFIGTRVHKKKNMTTPMHLATTILLIIAALAQPALAFRFWMHGSTGQAWVNLGLAVLWLVVLHRSKGKW